MGVLLSTLLAVAAFAAPEPTLEDKVKAVLPKPEEERWLQIPWRLNLQQARAEAQAQGKPMFLWIMNGNPLGCT